MYVYLLHIMMLSLHVGIIMASASIIPSGKRKYACKCVASYILVNIAVYTLECMHTVCVHVCRYICMYL